MLNRRSRNTCRILLIIPAYNEAESIGRVLDEVKDTNVRDMDVLVIDDGSSDDTVKVARAHGAEVVSQVYNMGYGAALQTGYKQAVDCGYAYVMQMDADGQHDARNLERICEELVRRSDKFDETPHIVIGSRFAPGAESFALNPAKAPIIRAFRKIICRATGYHLTDPTSGLWGLDRAAFTYLSKMGNFDTKYPDLNMILQILLEGYHIVEVPAIMHARETGTSMHSGLGNALRYGLTMVLSTACVLFRMRKKGKAHS